MSGHLFGGAPGGEATEIVDHRFDGGDLLYLTGGGAWLPSADPRAAAAAARYWAAVDAPAAPACAGGATVEAACRVGAETVYALAAAGECHLFRSEEIRAAHADAIIAWFVREINENGRCSVCAKCEANPTATAGPGCEANLCGAWNAD
jgi:hypothetical protein